MKDVSVDYIAQEEATKRKPVELYHIWRPDGSNERFYTSGDLAVIFSTTGVTVASANRKRLSNVATIETGVDHGLLTGEWAIIFGMSGTGYNGTWQVVSVLDTKHFTYANVGDDEVETVDVGGTIAKGDVYIPATLKRSLISYDSQLDVTKCTVQAAFVEDPVLEFIAINPVEIYWIKIMKLHRDQFPLEADTIFLGQIKGVTFKGIQADVECVGFEHFLKMPIPKERYQITCNWQLFDSKCDNPVGACSKEDYKIEALNITLDATKTILTAAIFATKSDGYFIGGVVEFPFENEKRTIVAHSGNTITMSYRMIHLEDGDDVNAYPGCDGRNITCRDEFVNIINFLGFPYIPIENPAMRT